MLGAVGENAVAGVAFLSDDQNKADSFTRTDRSPSPSTPMSTASGWAMVFTHVGVQQAQLLASEVSALSANRFAQVRRCVDYV